MTPYPPPATSSYPGLVQLPSGMTALSDWLDQALKAASSPTFANATISGNLTISHSGQLFLPNNGLHLSDSSESGHYLHVNCADVTLSADRSLAINVGNANRGLTIAGDSKLDQDVSSTGSPTFSSLALSSPLTAANGGTGLVALGTGVSSALSVNIGTGGSFITNGGALGTPSSGTVTNLTGTASININGTVGATTPAAVTGTSVTAIAASTQDAVKLSPRAGGTGSFVANITTTTLTASRTFTLPDATGTIVIGSGTSSGTNTGDQTITLTGEATGSGTGSFATTLTNSAVIGKVLTGYTSGAGTVSATDTILQAIQKLNGNDATNANLTGPITSVGNATSIASQTGTGTKFVVDTGPTITNAIINQAANGDTAIKSVRNTDTSPTGNFLDFQSAAAASIFKVDRYGSLTVNITAQASTAERLLTFGVSDSASTFTLDNGTTNANFFNPTFNGTIEATVEGVPISFFGTKGVDGTTNPAILFLYRHNTGGGNTDLSSTVTGVEFRNRATKGFGFTGGHNFQMCGSATLAAATAGIVSQAGVDNGGNREWQCQPAAGGFLAWGNNQFRRLPTANQDVYDWVTTVNTTDATQTTLATIPVTASRTYMIEARVAARRTGGASGTANDGASYCRRGTYTTKSGTVTLMGSVQTIGTDAEDQAAWDVTMTISSTNVLVRVTGAANNNVTWMGDIKIQSVAS